MKIIDKIRVDNSSELDYDSCNIPRNLEQRWKFQEYETVFAGMMVSKVMSNKLDGKERRLKEGCMTNREESGRYLKNDRYERTQHRKPGRYLPVILLLIWDGLLLYMIVECLIVPVYGAAFVAVISVYLGNKL